MYAVDINQSINRILKTVLGTRVMRPEFGSRLFELKDRKFNDEYKLLATKYTYEAIEAFEPRVKLQKVEFEVDARNGVVSLLLSLQVLELDVYIEEEKPSIEVEKRKTIAVIGGSGNPIITPDGNLIIVKVTND